MLPTAMEGHRTLERNRQSSSVDLASGPVRFFHAFGLQSGALDFPRGLHTSTAWWVNRRG
jgi:hypothetical protein